MPSFISARCRSSVRDVLVAGARSLCASCASASATARARRLELRVDVGVLDLGDDVALADARPFLESQPRQPAAALHADVAAVARRPRSRVGTSTGSAVDPPALTCTAVAVRDLDLGRPRSLRRRGRGIGSATPARTPPAGLAGHREACSCRPPFAVVSVGAAGARLSRAGREIETLKLCDCIELSAVLLPHVSDTCKRVLLAHLRSVSGDFLLCNWMRRGFFLSRFSCTSARIPPPLLGS
jgi:hypothetical protein